MRMIGGLVALLVGLLGGLFLYRAYLTQPPAVAGEAAPATTPTQTVNIIGIKSDLLSIAEAERAYQAEHSSIASLDELQSGGEISMKTSGREGYKYEIERVGEGFHVTARCTPPIANCTNYFIDQNMEISAEP
jgi:hypothetical protein